MGLCPIALPKGFPSVYGARLAHRPLETFGRKYLVLFLKCQYCQLDSPLFWGYMSNTPMMTMPIKTIRMAM